MGLSIEIERGFSLEQFTLSKLNNLLLYTDILLGWENWTKSLTMVLDSLGDKLDQTGVLVQTELNSHSEKL